MELPYVTDTQRNALFKPVRKSKHFFKKGNAWGIDKKIFDDAVANGITSIIYYDRDTGKEYKTMTEDVRKHAWQHNFGFGEQYFLAEKYWKGETI